MVGRLGSGFDFVLSFTPKNRKVLNKVNGIFNFSCDKRETTSKSLQDIREIKDCKSFFNVDQSSKIHLRLGAVSSVCASVEGNPATIPICSAHHP